MLQCSVSTATESELCGPLGLEQRPREVQYGFAPFAPHPPRRLVLNSSTCVAASSQPQRALSRGMSWPKNAEP